MRILALVRNSQGRLNIIHYPGSPEVLETKLWDKGEFLVSKRLKLPREHANFLQELANGVYYLYHFAVNETLDSLQRTKYPHSFPLRL